MNICCITQILSISWLIWILIKDLINIDELTSAEDKVSAHFKQLSQTLSDFDTETGKLLNILHTQRDEHVRLLLV